MSMEERTAETGAMYRRAKEELNREVARGTTLAEARIAKSTLEKDIARLLKEFGDLCQCEVDAIHIQSAIRSADERRPLEYRVEVYAKF